ncbi:MAG TPA: AbrB/MazE/SpoVT family DNA-binding domain-containing protein [Ignavibacteriaceae bacterium]|nr:AbrB/MazE/SpoVT family DNA-binding domain-containing protein [Ignavibacteriaceae bacterium]
MKITIAKLTSRGRLSIPVEIRKKFKIKAGEKIHFHDKGDKIKLIIKKNS